MRRQLWDPLRELEAMLRTHRPTTESRQGHEVMTTADWAPAVDIAETDEAYLINVELSEVARENVQVSANDGVLTIQGQRAIEEGKGVKYHRLERGYGKFARSFNLPEDVEAGQICAECRNGMLYLKLPKHKEAPAKAVEIKIK